MKVYMTHKDPKFSAYFTSTVWKNEDDYGNGIYLDIRRNGNEFKYIDCRYMTNFDEEKVLRKVIEDWYGSNLVAIDVIDELAIPEEFDIYQQDLTKDYLQLRFMGKVYSIQEARAMCKVFQEQDKLAQDGHHSYVFVCKKLKGEN